MTNRQYEPIPPLKFSLKPFSARMCLRTRRMRCIMGYSAMTSLMSYVEGEVAIPSSREIVISTLIFVHFLTLAEFR